jgi:ABC-type protease/lipase transport system fused ATPase/permease subunit
MMRVVDMIGVLRGGMLEKFGPRDQMLQELQAVPQAPTRKLAAMSDSA